MRTAMRPHAQETSHRNVLQQHLPRSRCVHAPAAARLPLVAAACSSLPQQRRSAPCSALRQSRRVATVTAAAAAAATEELQQAPVTADVKGLGFYTGDDGYLYCDSLRVDDIRQQVPESPFYLYSRDRVTASYQAYANVSLCRCRCIIDSCRPIRFQSRH